MRIAVVVAALLLAASIMTPVIIARQSRTAAVAALPLVRLTLVEASALTEEVENQPVNLNFGDYILDKRSR